MKKSTIFLAVLVLVLAQAILSLYSNSPFHISQDTDKNELDKTLKLSTESGGGYIMDTNAAYSWIEINETGIPMGLDDISDYGSIKILEDGGWNFTFYETNYSKIYVSTNGWMSFTNLGDTDFWFREIPGQRLENIDCICPFLEGLNLSEGGDVYYNFSGTAPNRYLVIEYYQVCEYYSDELVGNFQVILCENGTIKFQYKNVNDLLYKIGPHIGLDHGDMTNYNSYEASLPLNEKAITFEFDKLWKLNYTLGFNEGDQFTWQINEVNYTVKLSWIIDEVNHTAMEKVFGSNWEQSFGLPPEMNAYKKTKINVSLIKDNTTHWEIKYDMWDWISESSNFGSVPDYDPILIFRKEPLNYSQQHNLTNIIPLLIPKYCALYLRDANLTDHYKKLSVYEGGDLRMDIDFFGKLEGTMYYNEHGVLCHVNLKDNFGYTAFDMVIDFSIGSSSGGSDGDDGIDEEDRAIPLHILLIIIGVIGIITIVIIKRRKKISKQSMEISSQ